MAGYSSNHGSRRWSDVDAGDHHFFKLIDIPFSPFQNDFGDGDYDDDDDYDGFDFAGSAVGGAAGVRRRNCNYGSSRQEYLRSYTFCRDVAKPTVQERLKSRLKAAAWAAMAWTPYNLPRRVRRIKDKLALRSARHSLYSSQRSRNPGFRLPFLQPCFVA